MPWDEIWRPLHTGLGSGVLTAIAIAVGLTGGLCRFVAKQVMRLAINLRIIISRY